MIKCEIYRTWETMDEKGFCTGESIEAMADSIESLDMESLVGKLKLMYSLDFINSWEVFEDRIECARESRMVGGVMALEMLSFYISEIKMVPVDPGIALEFIKGRLK